MKNKLPEDSIFRKKSFFVALYSCVGVVLILAAVISYINIKQAKPNTNQSENMSANAGEAMANQHSPNPAIASPSADAALSQALADAAKQTAGAQQQMSGAQQQASSDTQEQTAGAQQQTTDTQQQMAANGIAKVKPSATPAPTAAASAVPASPAPAASEAPNATVQPDKAVGTDKSLAEPVFNSFKDGDTMEWPVLGSIVMDYSTDQLIHDVTLDQYRTNDNLWISATQGTPVKAAWDGVVQKIDKTSVDGTSVIIDDGNGWTTTYSQLLDSVLVKEGDVVKQGEVIGGVATPSIYGVLQGPHLAFKVAKDDVTVDPKTVLSAEDTQTVASGSSDK